MRAIIHKKINNKFIIMPIIFIFHGADSYMMNKHNLNIYEIFYAQISVYAIDMWHIRQHDAAIHNPRECRANQEYFGKL